MRLIEESLREIRETLHSAPEEGRTSYRSLIHSPDFPSYPMNQGDHAACVAWLHRLLNDPFLAQTRHSFSENPPKPRPDLRIVPPI
jgi:hypothetical protein